VKDYAPLNVPAFVTRQRGPGEEPSICGLAPVLEMLRGHRSVFVGHSGVGKSTLVNALVPGLKRTIGRVNHVTGRGRHTSTSALAVRLPDDPGPVPSWVIDTPGVRSFGLAHVGLADIVRSFPDLADGVDQCPRGCSHAEPGCALDAWAESGAAGSAGVGRVQSLRRLLAARGPEQ
ncbi:MAG: GTPase RsgA, partial [Angustibacter sp.]